MNQQFNSNELAVIASLLNRVSISGQEATAVAVLLQKINSLIQAEQAKPAQASPNIGQSLGAKKVEDKE